MYLYPPYLQFQELYLHYWLLNLEFHPFFSYIAILTFTKNVFLTVVHNECTNRAGYKISKVYQFWVIWKLIYRNFCVKGFFSEISILGANWLTPSKMAKKISLKWVEIWKRWRSMTPSKIECLHPFKIPTPSIDMQFLPFSIYEPINLMKLHDM